MNEKDTLGNQTVDMHAMIINTGMSINALLLYDWRANITRMVNMYTVYRLQQIYACCSVVHIKVIKVIPHFMHKVDGGVEYYVLSHQLCR